MLAQQRLSTHNKWPMSSHLILLQTLEDLSLLTKMKDASQKRACTAILQRVHSASVTVDQKLISQIGRGVLVFAAVSKEDSREDVESMAAKVLKMRMWDDDDGGRVTMLPIQNTCAVLTVFMLEVEKERARHSGRSTLWYERADTTRCVN